MLIVYYNIYHKLKKFKTRKVGLKISKIKNIIYHQNF